MMIDIPTILLALVVESLVMFLAAGLLLHRSARNRIGGSWLTSAIGMLLITLLLFMLREDLPHWLPPSVVGTTAITTMAMLSLAVTRFLHAGLPPLLTSAPVIISAVLQFAGTLSQAQHIEITGALLLCQEILLILSVLRRCHATPGIGKYMILLGLLINAGVLGIGMAGNLPELADFGNRATPGILFLTVFPTLNLVGLGYLLMEREAEDERFRQLALRDNLTQCWNRNYFEVAARHEMERFARHNTPVSLIMLDVDLFKAINDRFGHAVGDEILREFANTTHTCIRSADILARWGGEEFIILLPASGEVVAASIAERIRASFAQANIAGCQATVSAGYACCRPGESWESWFQRTDTALYAAKAHGRNRVEPMLPGLNRQDMAPMTPRIA